MKKSSCKLSMQAAALMYWGVKFSFGVLMLGIFAYFYNEKILSGGYYEREMCIRIVISAVSLFVQFIVGGLIFDCVKMKMDK